jgi:hypothetical protein
MDFSVFLTSRGEVLTCGKAEFIGAGVIAGGRSQNKPVQVRLTLTNNLSGVKSGVDFYFYIILAYKHSRYIHCVLMGNIHLPNLLVKVLIKN